VTTMRCRRRAGGPDYYGQLPSALPPQAAVLRASSSGW